MGSGVDSGSMAESIDSGSAGNTLSGGRVLLRNPEPGSDSGKTGLFVVGGCACASNDYDKY